MVSTISISVPWCYLEVGLKPLCNGGLFEAESLGALLVAGEPLAGGLEILLQKDVCTFGLASSKLRVASGLQGREGVNPVTRASECSLFTLLLWRAPFLVWPSRCSKFGEWGSGTVTTSTAPSVENPA